MSKMIDGRWQRTSPSPYRSWGDWMFEDDDGEDWDAFDEAYNRAISCMGQTLINIDDDAIWIEKEGSC